MLCAPGHPQQYFISLVSCLEHPLEVSTPNVLVAVGNGHGVNLLEVPQEGSAVQGW